MLLEILSVTSAAKKVRQIHLINKNGNNNQSKKPKAEAQAQLMPNNHEQIDNKNDFEGIEQYFNKNQFPPKVIHVTKTVAVHIPVAVPYERIPGGSEVQSNTFFRQQQQDNRDPFSTVQPMSQRRNTTPKPVTPQTPVKINSLEALNMQNSIWQQNFPPFSPEELKSEGQRSERVRSGSRLKQRKPFPTLPSKLTALEDIPHVASILISQDPNTKAINIQIPGNAGMSDNFLDDVQRNPMTLLKSLNLTPIQSFGSNPSPPSSFDVPILGTNTIPSAFSSSTSSFGRSPLSAETEDFPTFYAGTEIGDSSDLSALTEFSNSNFQTRPSSVSGNTFMPNYGDYVAARQKAYSLPPDTASSSSNATRYVTSNVRERPSKHHQIHSSVTNHQPNHDYQSNTIQHNAEVQYKTSYRYKNQPIDLSKFKEVDGTHFNQGSTSLFVGTFPKDDSRFSGSDVHTTLREYEKKVEKDIFDSTGMHSMKSYVLERTPEMEPTITPLVPLPLISERTKRLKTLPTLASLQKQKARDQTYKIKIKKPRM